MAHARKFKPQADMGSLQESDVRAFCAPCYDIHLLAPTQVLHLHGVVFTVADWSDLFLNLAKKNTPKWLSFDDSPAPYDSSAPLVHTTVPTVLQELLSPMTHEQSGGILALIPSLSFDDSVASSEEDGWPQTPDAVQISLMLQKFHHHFASLKHRWKRAFTEVKSSYDLMVQDVKKFQQCTTTLHLTLGDPIALANATIPSAWQGLQFLYSQLEAMNSTVDDHDSHLAHLQQNTTAMTQLLSSVEASADSFQSSVAAQLSNHDRDLRSLEKRFLKLVPFLQHLKGASMPAPSSSPVGSTHQDVTSIHQRLHELECAVTKLSNSSLAPDHRSSLAAFDHVLQPDSPLLVQVHELQAQMKQLQLRVVGKGVQIAKKVFQSFEDVQSWVTTYLPNRHYGLFVDGGVYL